MVPLSERLNPFAFYQTMRDSAPIYQSPQSGAWSVFRYEDVQTVLSDTTRFFSGDGEHDPEEMGPGASIIGMNPPHHRKMRDLVSRAFTPRAVQNLAPRIGSLIDDLLTPALAAGGLEVVNELTYPLPVTVIAEMLGIPTSDREQFKMWSDAIVSGTDEHQAGAEATRAMNAYFAATVSRRRQEMGDDLISSLIAAEVDGERLTDPEIISFCDLLLVAGNETTTNLITNAIWIFSEQPEVWEILKARRDLIGPAIEEVLRFRSPVQAMFRTARTDVALQGQTIPAGDTVIAWIGSANRDERKFPKADTFVPDRRPNQHIAFGHGIHYCLGAPLARLEAKLCLEALAEHGVKRFRPTVPLSQWEPLSGFIVHGVKRLPVALQ